MAIKKKDILPFATAWMDLESIMLSEISQSEKTSTICFHSYVESNEQNKLIGKMETDAYIQRTDGQLSDRGSLRGWVKKVKGLSKKTPQFIDNSMMITREKGVRGEVEKGKGET